MAHTIDIPTRACYSYDIPDKKVLEDVIEAHAADENKEPIINVKCNYELQSEVGRLKTMLSENAIVRVRGYNPEIEEKIEESKDSVGVEEILAQLVSTDSNEFELATKLLNSECDARFEVDSYIEKRIDELQAGKVS